MYRSALQHASDLLSAIDTHYRYLFANQAFLAYHGLRMEDVVGREVGEVLGDHRFAGARPALDRARRWRRGGVSTRPAMLATLFGTGKSPLSHGWADQSPCWRICACRLSL